MEKISSPLKIGLVATETSKNGLVATETSKNGLVATETSKNGLVATETSKNGQPQEIFQDIFANIDSSQRNTKKSLHLKNYHLFGTDWFRHWKFISFLYQADRMTDSPALKK